MIDGSRLIQTVNRAQNPKIYELLLAFKKLSGVVAASLLATRQLNFSRAGIYSIGAAIFSPTPHRAEYARRLLTDHSAAKKLIEFSGEPPDIAFRRDIILAANVSLVLSLLVAAGIRHDPGPGRQPRDRQSGSALEGPAGFVQTEEFAGFMYRINKGLIPATDAERKAMPAEDQIAFIQFAQEMESLGILVVDGSD